MIPVHQVYLHAVGTTNDSIQELILRPLVMPLVPAESDQNLLAGTRSIEAMDDITANLLCVVTWLPTLNARNRPVSYGVITLSPMRDVRETGLTRLDDAWGAGLR